MRAMNVILSTGTGPLPQTWLRLLLPRHPLTPKNNADPILENVRNNNEAALRDNENVPETVVGDGLQHQRRLLRHYQRSRVGMTEGIGQHVDEIRRLIRRLLLAEQSAPAVRATSDAATQTEPPPPFSGRTMRIFRPP